MAIATFHKYVQLKLKIEKAYSFVIQIYFTAITGLKFDTIFFNLT